MSSGTPPEEVTRLLQVAEESQSAERLLELVYDQLRKIAQQRMADERAGHTLQATALVHEAYLRVTANADVSWRGRAHFFAAAAEAMRRILIDHARARVTQKRGGAYARQLLHESQLVGPRDANEMIELDEALSRLGASDSTAAGLVKLRFFAGLTNKEAAEILEISPRKADQLWAFARAWLRDDLGV